MSYKAMDQKTKDFIKGEVENLAILINRGFETTTQTMREEVRGMEKGLRQDMEILKMDVSAVKREMANLKLEFEEARTEAQETRAAVLRVEHALQDRVEAQGDELQDTRQRVGRIEKHLGLPHSLAA
jgi:chromosome segregation ATPase